MDGGPCFRQAVRFWLRRADRDGPEEVEGRCECHADTMRSSGLRRLTRSEAVVMEVLSE